MTIQMCEGSLFVYHIKQKNLKNLNQRESGIKQIRDNWSKQLQPQAGLEVLSSHPLTVFEDSVVVTREQ